MSRGTERDGIDGVEKYRKKTAGLVFGNYVEKASRVSTIWRRKSCNNGRETATKHDEKFCECSVLLAMISLLSQKLKKIDSLEIIINY